MKFLSVAVLLANTVSNANAEALTYTPNKDVTDHSKITLDQLDISDHIDDGNYTDALNIYLNGKNREGKSLQAMAQKKLG
jgi:hypothetical protein